MGCPDCGRELPTDRRYAIWCRQCQWNLDPEPVGEQPGWRAERERRLADDLAERRASGPERSLSAFLLSLPVLLVPLPCLLGGLALLVFYRPLWFAIPFAAVAFTLSAIFRPRIRRLPEGAEAVTRRQAPQLYDVLDRLAAQTGTPKLHEVVVTTDTRIAIERIGRRYRRTLRLGLPAWAVLSPQERYAVLAHALYDDQLGLHDRVLGAAQHILGELAAAVTPGALDMADDWTIERSEGVDYRVGRGSTDHVLHDRDGDPLEALRRTAAEIPEHEFARLVLTDRARSGRSGADHPPTWQRTRLLRAHPAPATTVPGPANDDELTAAARIAAAHLRDYC